MHTYWLAFLLEMLDEKLQIKQTKNMKWEVWMWYNFKGRSYLREENFFMKIVSNYTGL